MSAVQDANLWMQQYHKSRQTALYAWLHAIQGGPDEKRKETKEQWQKRIAKLAEIHADLASGKERWQRRADEMVFWERYWKEHKRMKH